MGSTVLALVLASALDTEAGSYTFAKIADNTGTFTKLHSPPAINPAGTVVFTADRAAGGQGIFTGSGGPLTTIAQSGGPFLSVGGNTINADGTVVVWVTLAAGGDAIFTGNGGPLTLVADTTAGVFSSLWGRASIDAAGTVVFGGSLAAGGSGIFAGSGGPTRTI
ncbi:MAG: hypothetical protein ACREMG_06570, partial [Gemmatimonadales bacterium]